MWNVIAMFRNRAFNARFTGRFSLTQKDGSDLAPIPALKAAKAMRGRLRVLGNLANRSYNS